MKRSAQDTDVVPATEPASDENMPAPPTASDQPDQPQAPAAKRARTAPPPTTTTSIIKPTRAGGVYVPRFKRDRHAAQATPATTTTTTTDAAAAEAEALVIAENNQRASWEDLRRGVNGIVNKVNVDNLAALLPELFALNLIRGRGLLCQSIVRAQMAAPDLGPIFAATVAIINTKLPALGLLLLGRVLKRLRRALKRSDTKTSSGLAQFLAHLINQKVAHEILGLQFILLLLNDQGDSLPPSDTNIETAASFLTACGHLLLQVAPQGVHLVYERLREILQDGQSNKRMQYVIEKLFEARKDQFSKFLPISDSKLDLVEASDQITHELDLDDVKVDL